MRIPSCFYGRKKEARRECDKAARKILRGVPLLEAVAGYEMIDTESVPEVPFIICNPYGIIDNAPHFYMTLIADAIRGKFWTKHNGDRDTYEMAVKQFIEHSWSILGLSDDIGWLFASPKRECDLRHMWQPYLRKLCEFWDIFNKEGGRYFGKGGELSSLWEANRTLSYVLHCMGLPDEDAGLCAVESPSNLRRLCEKYGLFEMDVLNNSNILKKNPFVN